MSGYRILSFDGGPAALTVLPCLIELERKSGEQCRGLLGDRSLRLGPVSLLPTNEAAMLLLLGLDEVAIAFGELTALLWRVTWPAELVQWLGFQPSFTQSISWIESAWAPAEATEIVALVARQAMARTAATAVAP